MKIQQKIILHNDTICVRVGLVSPVVFFEKKLSEQLLELYFKVQKSWYMYSVLAQPLT